MRSMLVRQGFAAIACWAMFAVLGADPGYADSVAVNGGATSITRTTAILHGSAHTTDADSGWLFQYGTTTAYGKSTPVIPIHAANYSFQALITGLRPGTTYHYRLVVAQGSYPSKVSFSGDLAFTTRSASGGGGGRQKYGHASLTGRLLKVRGQRVSIPFSCAGTRGTACKGRISLTARGKLGKQVQTIKCGAGKFGAAAGKSSVTKLGLGSGCLKLLHRAAGHKLSASLKAVFTTGQPTLRAQVTLLG